MKGEFTHILNKLDDKELDMLRGSAILVTGAGGYIGSMLIKSLTAVSESKSLKLRIIGLARTKTVQTCDYKRVEMYYGDIREKINIAGDIDYIIHCASVTNSRTMKDQPVRTFLTSVEGTKNILDMAYEKRVRSMVYISSMEAYGTHASNPYNTIESKDAISDDVTEDMMGFIDLKNPRSSYPEGKRAAEFLCNAYYAEYGVPVRIARLAQTFGQGVSVEDNRVFAQFAKSVLEGTDIILHTDGSSEGNYCHILDTVSGILIILLRGKNGETYNVVNEALHMTIRSMAEYVAKEVGKEKINVITRIPENPNEYGYAAHTKIRLSSKKLRALGWSPEFSMKDMYEHMMEHWKEQKG